MGGKPVIFVNAGSADGCAMADRWKAASEAANFYIVLKVFPGYASCVSQPDNWHQFGPAAAADSQAGHAYTISPGFWQAAESAPRLSRDLTRWNQNIRDMLASSAPLKLVTTFN